MRLAQRGSCCYLKVTGESAFSSTKLLAVITSGSGNGEDLGSLWSLTRLQRSKIFSGADRHRKFHQMPGGRWQARESTRQAG